MFKLVLHKDKSVWCLTTLSAIFQLYRATQF